MFNVLLCIPPDYDYQFPPLATPALCAFLKHNKIPVSQIDLNLGYRDFLLGHIQGEDLSLNMKNILLKDILRIFFIKKLQKRYYSDILPRTSDRVSLDLPYNSNSNSSFYFTERLLESGELFRYLEDKSENTFLQFYEKKGVIRYLEENRINLLGISIISPAQVIASLTLGLLIKKNLPRIHVNIGGQWPTLYRRQLMERKKFFACFDSMIVFEGETPLFKLARALKKGSSLDIPNVIFKHTKTDFSRGHSEEDMNELPCPDFGGLELARYGYSSSKRIALTYETSRGCYWSKCAYCVDLPLPKPSYRAKDAKLVVQDMSELKKKAKAANLMFGDPGLSPRQMLEISRQIIKKKVKIDWWTMARLDPGFNRKIFDLAFKAGLKQINFGFESACDRVCDLLDKGNRKERSQRVIRDCALAGIQVDLQTMIGLPGETLKDGLETVDFLITNKDFIDDVTFNIYYLTPANHVYMNPDKYGIEYERDQGFDFRFFTPFKNKAGINNQDASLLEKVYQSLVFRAAGIKADKSKGRVSLKRGRLEFSLNNESILLRYFYNPLNGELRFSSRI